MVIGSILFYKSKAIKIHESNDMFSFFQNEPYGFANLVTIEFILKKNKMEWHYIIILAENPTFEYKTIKYAGTIG